MKVVRWIEAKPLTWCPIDLELGIVTTGLMFCNTLPKDCEEIGEFVYEADPIFSKPKVTFYENAYGLRELFGVE